MNGHGLSSGAMLSPTMWRQAPQRGAGGMFCSALRHGPTAVSPRPSLLLSPARNAPQWSQAHGAIGAVQLTRGGRRAAERLPPRASSRDAEVESAAKDSRTEGSSVALGQVQELELALEAFTAARSAQESREQESARAPGGRGAPAPVSELEAGRKALELARSLAAAGVLRGFGKGPQASLRAGSCAECLGHAPTILLFNFQESPSPFRTHSIPQPA